MEYPGASPAEVEEAIVRRIEEKVAGLAGIKRIDSVARESFATVTIEVMNDWDLQELLDEVKAEVDRISTFPNEAEEPIVREVTRRRQVLNVTVFGDAPESTIKHLTERIKDDITNLPGITLAELAGLRKGEIHIEVSEESLRRYGLTLGKVAEAVRRASLDLPAGSVKTAGGEILVRTKGRRYYAGDYRDIAVISRTDFLPDFRAKQPALSKSTGSPIRTPWKWPLLSNSISRRPGLACRREWTLASIGTGREY
jgi:multidrug efflux pump subunit AcrB